MNVTILTDVCICTLLLLLFEINHLIGFRIHINIIYINIVYLFLVEVILILWLYALNILHCNINFQRIHTFYCINFMLLWLNHHRLFFSTLFVLFLMLSLYIILYNEHENYTSRKWSTINQILDNIVHCNRFNDYQILCKVAVKFFHTFHCSGKTTAFTRKSTHNN